MLRLCLLIFVLNISSAAFGQITPAELHHKSKKSLAQLEGNIAFPGLKAPVEILRDRWGVPHIYAKNADDLFFAQGVVVAQDRLFQIDWWRRLAVGETAEVIGPAGLEADKFARLVRYRGDMKAEWASYSPDTQQIATAFTSGINAYIDHIGKNLPIEFQLLGYEPKKWRPEDVLGRMSGIYMSQNFRNEIARAQLIAAVGVEKANWLAPVDPKHAFAPAPGLDLAGIDQRVLSGYAAATKLLHHIPAPTESNNWVVDGKRSASGKPLLASDPHRAIALPSLRYLVHLNAPGWNVIGSGEPGLPGVALGHNEKIAWGFTIIGTDQADIVVEDINPREPSQYLDGSSWQVMKVVHDTIPVKGKPDEKVELRFTRRGPVLFQDSKTNRAFALKWSGHEPGGAAYLGSLAVGRAQNKALFLKALEAWKIPGLNFVYADKDDNIGWVAAALTPKKKHDGLLPVPGGRGGHDWSGYLSVAELAQRFNPEEGFVATANHNIIPEDYKHQIGYEFAPSYRFDRVRHGLAGKDKLNLEAFKRLQHDSVSLPGLALAKLLKGLKWEDKSLEPFAKKLIDWDGDLSVESTAGPLYAVWLKELQDDLLALHLPKGIRKDVAGLVALPTQLAALENADPRWFANPAARDKLVQDSLARAVGRVKKLPARWGELHTVTFRHPMEKFTKDHAAAFNVGPFERPGEGHTPLNARYDENFKQIHGATYRHLFDLSDWDKGVATSAPGQSGQLGSPHYGDLAPLWAKGEYFPLAYSRKKVEEVTSHRLLLTPR